MPLIVIEGLDGSGKATSAALLEKRLTDEGKANAENILSRL